MPVRYLNQDERTVMESLWRHLDRHYARPVSARVLRQVTGLGSEELEAAVRSLTAEAETAAPPAAGGARTPSDGKHISVRHDANRPYLSARWARGLQGVEKLVEIRLTTEGQQYCAVRD